MSKLFAELSKKELDEYEEKIGMKMMSENRELAHGSAILYHFILAEYSRRQRSKGGINE